MKLPPDADASGGFFCTRDGPGCVYCGRGKEA